ncbi:DUF6090 family protein [Yeosuana sp. MJ-SS3]|uniref:DUF6090 family protein n=1 Tax=Gilvirhabdus luticola TaxID=3079858 RepID=A0ABU3U817_9FLAO|nr:DUF6090 family protein [Yeosuana sp. MJ-SS3]MDU8886547.1 DUF6090 family protein [Yeosuana sp. MJ-SS3]
MIKFFRRIRQKMLTENKFSKYLFYAVGEIILVVIGILIALSVNNWNQENKDRRLGNDYLLRIHHDLVQDTTAFRNIITQNNALREDIKKALVTLYNGVDDIEQVKYISEVYDKALDQVFTPNDNTYRGMVSSGTLGLIYNLELKESIIDLYSDYDQKGALLLAIGNWMISMATAESTQTDLIKFGSGVIDIFTTSEMLNEYDYAFLNNKEDPNFKMLVRAISATAFNQKASNGIYMELISKCDKVLQRIDQELKIN